MSYALLTALRGLWREKWINLVCMFSLATGIFIIVFSFIVVYNMQYAAGFLPERFAVMAFLDDEASVDGVRRIVSEVKDREEVRSVRYISKDEALEELRLSLKDSDMLLKGLEENPLPASMEISLRKGSVRDTDVERLTSDLRRMEGVTDVYYPSEILRVIQAARRYSEASGTALIVLLSAALLFVSYSTVKILFYRKLDEIETLKLLGATRMFIRMPFMLEGGIIGLMGGVLGFAGMLFLYFLIYYRFALSFPILNNIATPAGVIFAMPAFGLVIGIVGSMLAIGRIRY